MIASRLVGSMPQFHATTYHLAGSEDPRFVLLHLCPYSLLFCSVVLSFELSLMLFTNAVAIFYTCEPLLLNAVHTSSVLHFIVLFT